MMIQIKVIPGAARSEVVGFEGEILRVRLNAPPEKGKANRELVIFLAGWLGISRTRVSLLAGETSRLKRVELEGIERADIEGRL
jgi:uncharacterized protein